MLPWVEEHERERLLLMRWKSGCRTGRHPATIPTFISVVLYHIRVSRC